MQTPKISIVTAVFNGASTIQRCIDSVASQLWPNKEHIIIDGGSNDGTVGIIKTNVNKITYWESKSDRGVYHAWNKGLQHAKGDWIIFLSSDDTFIDESVLETFVKKIDSLNELPPLAYGNVLLIDSSGDTVEVFGDTWENSKININKTMPIPHPGCFHYRNLFLKYGFFDEQFKIAGDYDLILRFYKNSPPIYLSDFTVTKMQTGGISNAPSSYYKVLIEAKKAQRKNNIASFSLMWYWRVFKHFVKYLFYTINKT
jgi:glycosyltransferase involved in cell wall biosynthesis